MAIWGEFLQIKSNDEIKESDYLVASGIFNVKNEVIYNLQVVQKK